MPSKSTLAKRPGATFERTTRQRSAILDVFASAGRPLSAEEVLEAAQAASQAVSLATVYRSVRALVDEGSLARVDAPGGTFYELAGKAHHHHFACVECGRVYELTGCARGLAIKLPRGFRAISHEVTVHGRCRSCVAAP